MHTPSFAHTTPNLNNANNSGGLASRSPATPTREATSESVDDGFPSPRSCRPSRAEHPLPRTRLWSRLDFRGAVPSGNSEQQRLLSTAAFDTASELGRRHQGHLRSQPFLTVGLRVPRGKDAPLVRRQRSIVGYIGGHRRRKLRRSGTIRLYRC